MRADNAEIKEQEKTYAFKLKHHQLTVKGQADDSGLILTNATNNDDGLTPQQREKKKAEKEADLRRILNDAMEALKARSVEIGKAIDAGQKIKDAYKKGELDYSNPEHILWMKTFGITREEIEAGGIDAIEAKEEKWFEEKQSIDAKIEAGTSISNDLDAAPDDLEKRQDAIDYLDKLENVETLFAMASTNTSDVTEDIVNSEYNGDELVFESGSISAAKSIDPSGNISNMSIKDVFAVAHDGKAQENTLTNVTPTTAPSLSFS